MRVKFVRRNGNGLDISRAMLRETDYLYDSQGDENDKNYARKNHLLELGFEANVYALSMRRDCISYYIKEPG